LDLFEPAPDPAASIPPDLAHQVAIAFGLTVADVRVDVRDVASWVGPDAELLAALERRRRLAPTLAATYLARLRRALIAG
jgi:hypothetical protein